MGSLFTKIFLTFWLAALLLGAAQFAVQRLQGGEAIAEVQRDLSAQAMTVAALWQEGGPRAVGRWLHGQPDEESPLLVDAGGERVVPQRLPHHLARWLPRSMEPGVFPLGPGHAVVVEALPGVAPPLYLMAELRPWQLPLTPLWLRLLLAVAVVGLVSFGLATLLTRRLRRLRHAAQALAGGDLTVRVEQNGSDEVAALARDFNLMADQVCELLETQKRLLRDVSHELRSPLARLRVALELAERDGDAEKAVARIGKEAEELEQLIANVLSLARLESGQSGLERRAVPLAELIAQVVTDADFEAQLKERRVIFAAAPALTVQGDPVALRSAVENVVRNGLRYTAPQSAVEVNLAAAQDQARITVRDHGPGVPAGQLAAIFTPFARSGEARERGGGGYGLGLAITSRAVAAHGGTVQAENHPDGGLVVTITLPTV